MRLYLAVFWNSLISIIVPIYLFFDKAFILCLGDENVDSLEMIMNENEQYLPEYNLDPGWTDTNQTTPKSSKNKRNRSSSISSRLEALFDLKPDAIDLSVVHILTVGTKND